MATRLPLVIVAGQIEQLQAGDTLDIRSDQFQLINDEASPIVIGAPVYSDANGGVKKAQANAAGTKDVVGLVAQTSIANGVAGAIVINGLLTATTAQWDAVTGDSGGLTFKSLYYLDPATAGKLTKTAPSTTGQYVAVVGEAISTVDMKVNVLLTILL